MQIGQDNGYHLTYCTNIHPGETWEEVFESLQTYTVPLKARVAPDRPFGIGLRLSDQAARTLLQGDRLSRFRSWLDAHDLYVFVINGFPYGGFHRQTVKDQVYAPDWRTQDRVDYTLRLADILAALLPDGLTGGISTAPVSYKPWLDKAGRTHALETGARQLAQVAAALARLKEQTGKTLHIDLEPEPDCLIENTAETVDFFEQHLLPDGGAYLANQEFSRSEAEACLREHIRLCYDTCHFAVEYEAPSNVFARMKEAGIQVGRIQISAALRVPLPEEAAERNVVAERLSAFAESTYLHQVIERRQDGTLHHYADLPAALSNIAQPDAREWRIHFHVPVFTDAFEGLYSTRPDIVATLEALPSIPECRYLEIETYTWEVLPPALKMDLPTSIEREYEWVLQAGRDAAV